MKKTPKIHNPPRRCVFCGGGNITKEHIWSDWLKKLLGVSPVHTQSGFRERTEYPSEKSEVLHIFPKNPTTKQGDLGQKKIKNVCRSCNSGWMSQIVERAKPTAERLIMDAQFPLNERGQKALSAWIAIATIMAEFTEEDTRAIPADDREFLMKTGFPPDHWTICIGRYSGVEWAPIRYRHLGAFMMESSTPRPVGIPYGNPKNSQLTTYVLGSLLIHVFSSQNQAIAMHWRKRRLPIGMLTIWPNLNTVSGWPIGFVFDDERTDFISLMGAGAHF